MKRVSLIVIVMAMLVAGCCQNPEQEVKTAPMAKGDPARDDELFEQLRRLRRLRQLRALEDEVAAEHHKRRVQNELAAKRRLACPTWAPDQLWGPNRRRYLTK